MSTTLTSTHDEDAGAPRIHTDPAAAIDDIVARYHAAARLAMSIAAGDVDATYWSQVTYPQLTVTITAWTPIDRTAPFGYVDSPGSYRAIVSRPHIMADYLLEQLDTITRNYDCVVTVENSAVRIPPEYLAIDNGDELRQATPLVPAPCLDDVDDGVVDGDWDAFHGPCLPLTYFGPQRFDIACERIRHYTGIDAASMQRYILFTNYSMHTAEFAAEALRRLAAEDSRYDYLRVPTGEIITAKDAHSVDPADFTASSTHQMPRYDLVAANGTGMTIINIGVGPSNAKTITDCVAVLRPECWIMIGHCAGLDARMRIGDLILANAYQRADHILDSHIGHDIPIPAIPEVQRALEKAVKTVYGDRQQLMRTGTVMTSDDRNWEWHTTRQMWRLLNNSTAVAVDMESATLAANGYRYRVPYGSLLSVSDLPLHNVPKLPAKAQTFYRSSKQAHVIAAMTAIDALIDTPAKLHTRKLRRTIGEVPFR